MSHKLEPGHYDFISIISMNSDINSVMCDLCKKWLLSKLFQTSVGKLAFLEELGRRLGEDHVTGYLRYVNDTYPDPFNFDAYDDIDEDEVLVVLPSWCNLLIKESCEHALRNVIEYRLVYGREPNNHDDLGHVRFQYMLSVLHFSIER